MRAWVIIAGILALALAAGASAKVYKWVDDEGQVHYGQQPPQGVDADAMSVESAPPSSSGSSNGSGNSDDARGDAGEGTKAGSSDVRDEEEARVAENCKTARQNLKVLETAGPGSRFRGPDGEVKRYDEETWQARVDRNKKYIEVFCQDQKK